MCLLLMWLMKLKRFWRLELELQQAGRAVIKNVGLEDMREPGQQQHQQQT